MSDFREFVRGLPKAELHLHIEGTLEPSMVMSLAEKHGVQLPYNSIEDIEKAYQFDNLQNFLDLYYLGAGVLREEQDFYDLMTAYLKRCSEDGIVHTEMMFDPQTHTDRGIDFSVFMSGFRAARKDAETKWGISTRLIMCFLRHLPEAAAFETLEAAEPYRDEITAVGLDSSELGHPPEKYAKVYAAAKAQGYRLVAHAGEEGPPDYIHGSLDLLGVERIDHGVRCLEDDKLVERLVENQTPLTVCPLSNVRLRVCDTMSDHPLLTMLEKGLNVCVNSDDPPYFGGYLLDNFVALHESLSLSESQTRQLAINSIQSSFLKESEKQAILLKMPA
ncbi:MAG: adenosine deaminase [Candidatus Azotimanducaceae bacterium]|jgi:adenosine deaminase